MRQLLLSFALLCTLTLQAGENRWHTNNSHSVQWDTSNGELPYNDHIEMAGLRAAVVYYWGVDAQKHFSMDRHLVFPMLRTIPNNTHASWMPRCDVDFLKGMTANKRLMSPQQVKVVTINGILNVFGTVTGDGNDFELMRQYFPSTSNTAVCEKYTIKNIGQKKETVLVPATYQVRTTNKEDGTRGSYCLVARTEFKEDFKKTLEPGESTSFYCSIQAYAMSDEKEIAMNVEEELTKRKDFVQEVAVNKLRFYCPDNTITTLFEMSKIREHLLYTRRPDARSRRRVVLCCDVVQRPS